MSIDKDIKRLGNNIKSLRLKKKFSINQLAKLSKLHKNTIAKYEKGKGNPLISSLYKLSKALNNDLFTLCKGL